VQVLVYKQRRLLEEVVVQGHSYRFQLENFNRCRCKIIFILNKRPTIYILIIYIYLSLIRGLPCIYIYIYIDNFIFELFFRQSYFLTVVHACLYSTSEKNQSKRLWEYSSNIRGIGKKIHLINPPKLTYIYTSKL
jgi:hypothetical protein